MEIMTRVFLATTVCFAAVTTVAGQAQHIAPGEVPEGITSEDWGIVQEAYLKASNTDGADGFGGPVAISGDTIVIGAIEEDSFATGINGNESDNSASSAGAAYVFVRNGTTWSHQAYLKASNTDAADRFGGSVAIAGDTIVIGAPEEDSSATGVNGNQADNSTSGSGAVYVFVRNGATWSQQAYLKASNTDIDDTFGVSVGIAGNTVIIGSNYEDSSATGVNGNQADNSTSGSGAAYVFVRNGTTWSQQAYLKASNTDIDDTFGVSVGISGNTVIIGSNYEDSNATGVNGNQADNSAGNSGAVYVFVRNGTTWTQQAYLKASNTDAWDRFGGAVTISGDTAVVGAITEDSSSSGVNGNQADNSASASGAAYVFARNGTTWSQQAYIKASNTDAEDGFSVFVAISGGTFVIGAVGEASSATGVNGNQSNNSAWSAGAAYVFTGFGIEGSATITDCSSVPAGFRLEWTPVAGWDSIVKYSTNLVNNPFTNLSAALPYPVNSYTDTVSNGKCFYRVVLEP